jgi:hypothetical protein
MAGFRDSADGAFDMSTYLLERKGALPVPIVITEPAVGYGGGAALMFFRQSVAELAAQSEGRARYRPPDMFGAAAFGTENGTWGAAGGAMVGLGDDRWRITGGGGYASMNLSYYAEGGTAAGYNLTGYGGMAKVQYRIARSSAWISAHGRVLEIDSKFDQSALAPFLDEKQMVAGIGPSIEYDTRDNIFTPSSGWIGYVEGMFYDPAFGADRSFQIYHAHAYAYLPLPGPFVLGARADGGAANGDTPFYMLPYLGLRGIPAVRYQGERTALAEGELRWNVNRRWALLGFYGAGRAWGSLRSFEDVNTHASGGTGFRYLVARRLGVYSGLDFAWGPDFAFYIQMGSAWR